MNVDWRTLPNAPDAGTRVCSLQELEQGEIRQFCFAGRQPTETAFRLLVYRHTDEVYAYVNQCPHHWLAMNRADGRFLKWSQHEVMCAHHSAVFNLVDNGVCIMGPCQGSNLISVPVDVIDGEVFAGRRVQKS